MAGSPSSGKKKARPAKVANASAKPPAKTNKKAASGKKGKSKDADQESTDGRGRPRKVVEPQLGEIRAFGPEYVEKRDGNDGEGVKTVFRTATGKILEKYGWDDPFLVVDSDDELESDPEPEDLTDAQITRAEKAKKAKKASQDDDTLATVYKVCDLSSARGSSADERRG